MPHTDKAEKFRSFSADYTREVGGERYSYVARFTFGDAISWNADVSRDDLPKGHLSGSFDRAGFDEPEVVGAVKALIEEEIESLNGIDE
ncbi:hypothetical protein [Herbaspirillum robiniae]|uniref:Uncharacterized protein n=1 Tax=Herbaspirillum robiniae TaxID=2014887 RepID=A0A246WR63_9BURK|nr:hypothetical protein [Herbaspirillum robiniae]NUU01981.1 hypothetical protein [Herbaspirillum robiniae]OWY28891.1 hypothetical protein CEJ42_13065 [Herbaspirillum robiniae]